jgi:mono/diheme cytochrome c family protein/glucose/arabinose dehydrogenase
MDNTVSGCLIGNRQENSRTPMKLIWSLLIFAAALPLFAQNGDKQDEVQAPPPATLMIPPAPPLSVEEALKTFKLQPGFRIEVVASEPMVEAPVEIEFDAAGNLYVLEMRGFMPNVEGRGEDQRVGRVSLLTDTNFDGRMDKHAIFADNLLMPRAIAPVRGGLLIAEPPMLWFFRDTDGDGKADQKEMVASDYGNQSNPEHNANGLLWGLDNWIYSANHTTRYRNTSGYWEKEPTNFRGQWGISQDDFGRLFFNSNSDQLRADLVPAHYLSRNANFKNAFGTNVQIARDQTTFPARINPGVNRGYQQGTLKPDGTLAKFTGACGPVIYRGDLFPKEFRGAAFLCEPTANLVRCNFLTESNGMITATNVFPNAEFLASTDERFRPVNLQNGPDGALYIVDLARGVIQHHIYLTTFLRNQALDRKLETPLNQGRIYRIVPTDGKPAAPQNLAHLATSELVNELNSPNGWIRDTAQRLLVERRDFVALPVLERLAASGIYPGAMHALWALHGLNAITSEPVTRAIASSHPRVRATAVRVAESLINRDDTLAQKVIALAQDPSIDVQLQVMFSLGELRAESAERVMLELLAQHSEHPLLRDAAISGLKDRELPFLARVIAHPVFAEKSAGREEILRDLAACVAQTRNDKSVNELLEMAAAQKERWSQFALFDGLATLIPAKGKAKETPKPKPIIFQSEPPAIAKLAAAKDEALQKRLTALEPLLVWKGKAGQAIAEVTALTDAEQKLFAAGKEQYPLICGACHQPTGLGLEGLAPPLVESDWATGSPERVARIVLQGVRGPLNVKGKVWELEMPPVNVLSDDEIAALLTYIRREWGHTASPITPGYIAKVRQATESREEAWTEPELLKIP